MTKIEPLNNDRLIVVTYDAGKNDFTVNPNPATIPPGTHKLYFALQTVNKGHAEEAVFTSIPISCDSATCTPPQALSGFDRIFETEITNELGQGEEPLRIDYTPYCSYDDNNRQVGLDPTIILLPPPDGLQVDD